MDRWKEIEVFVQIADMESLSKAAEALSMSISATSRHLAALEERLNVRLIQRTTRKLSLTGEGEQFYHRGKDMLASMREAEASLSAGAMRPTGLLRVSASLSFCLLHLTPIIPAFTQRYPEVKVEIIASNRYYDLVENGVDMAIRVRRIEADSSITIRRLAETRRVLAASPTYLRRHGTPTHPSDLEKHDMILYVLSDNWNQLNFSKGGETVSVSVSGPVHSNDGQIIRATALDHLGILAQPAYIIQDDLDAGRLVRVLDDWDLPRLTMNIVFPTKAHLPAKTRLFIDFLVQRFKDGEYEKIWTQ
ncbi:MAG: LysR family transcriptional regulator [Rhizobium sp.]|nr:LysR family transcriptional regulator [Rhizobium sp.]